MNKSEKTYLRDQLAYAFADPEGYNDEQASKPMTELELKRELDDYDEAIAECHSMFLYSKEVGNEEEMRFWRSQEQENKTAKRLMMKNYRKEVAAA